MTRTIELSEFSEGERELYREVFKTLPESGTVARSEFLCNLYENETIPVDLKRLLSYNLYNDDVVRRWSFCHNSGYELAALIRMNKDSDAMRELLLTNRHLDAEGIAALCTVMREAKKDDSEILAFAIATNSSALNHTLIQEAQKQADIPRACLLTWTRAVYELDSSIPDTWVEKMLHN